MHYPARTPANDAPCMPDRTPVRHGRPSWLLPCHRALPGNNRQKALGRVIRYAFSFRVRPFLTDRSTFFVPHPCGPPPAILALPIPVVQPPLLALGVLQPGRPNALPPAPKTARLAAVPLPMVTGPAKVEFPPARRPPASHFAKYKLHPSQPSNCSGQTPRLMG
jgi:hypothetical protein